MIGREIPSLRQLRAFEAGLDNLMNTMETDTGIMSLPNSQVLASAVGPIPRPQPAIAQLPADEKPNTGSPPAGQAPSPGAPGSLAAAGQEAGDPGRAGHDDPPHGMPPGGGPPR